MASLSCATSGSASSNNTIGLFNLGQAFSIIPEDFIKLIDKQFSVVGDALL